MGIQFLNTCGDFFWRKYLAVIISCFILHIVAQFHMDDEEEQGTEVTDLLLKEYGLKEIK
jgi:hypothetical protein